MNYTPPTVVYQLVEYLSATLADISAEEFPQDGAGSVVQVSGVSIDDVSNVYTYDVDVISRSQSSVIAAQDLSMAVFDILSCWGYDLPGVEVLGKWRPAVKVHSNILQSGPQLIGRDAANYYKYMFSTTLKVNRYKEIKV